MEEYYLETDLELHGMACKARGSFCEAGIRAIKVWVPGDCVVDLADLDETDQQIVITALETVRSKLRPKV